MPNSKTRRLKDIPDKLYDLIALPDANDYTTYRDPVQYPQFEGQSYTSIKWPDELFGLSPHDIIRINIYGNNEALITTEYITHDKFESFINTNVAGHPAIVKLDTGKILRDLGYRRGRFHLVFDFLRVEAGGPFPLLVNGAEKIFKGSFENTDDKLYAAEPHVESDTAEGDALYVKENKFIIQEISSAKDELIVSPAFINDENYKERFRMAAYNCLNWFPEDGMTAQFPGVTSNFITFTTENNLPTNWVNGTIRINDAYFMGKRITPEETDTLIVEPEVDIESRRPNLLGDMNMDSLFGWKSHDAWPSAASLSTNVGFENRALFLDAVAEPNPSGQLAIKSILQNILNLSEEYLNESGKTANSLVSINLAFNLTSYVSPVDIEGITFTSSVWVKAPENSALRLLSHSGPWGPAGNTSHSQIVMATGEWQRITHTFTLTNTTTRDLMIRCIWDPRPANIDPSMEINLGKFATWAGAQLEQGSSATPFTRQSGFEDGTVEVALNGTIKFQDPDGKLLNASFADGDEFLPEMVGGLLKINDAIAIDDLSEVTMINDAAVEKIFEPTVIPKDGEEGKPGGYTPGGWDQELNGRAILVTDLDGDAIWTSGYAAFGDDERWSTGGTGEHGYQSHWRKDKGIEGGPAMFFPDLNYQPYILEPMRAAAIEAWTSPDGYYASRGQSDPRFDNNYHLADWWQHRHQQISTDWSTIGTLASYGVKPGDTIKISWMQKSAPVNFDQGGRKGAQVGLDHFLIDEILPPEDPSIESSEIYEMDAQIFNAVNPGPEFNTSNDYFDPEENVSGEFVNRRPSADDVPEGYNVLSPQEYPEPKPPVTNQMVGATSPRSHWIMTDSDAEFNDDLLAEIEQMEREDFDGRTSGNQNEIDRLQSKLNSSSGGGDAGKAWELNPDYTHTDFTYNEQLNSWTPNPGVENRMIGTIRDGFVNFNAILIPNPAFGWRWDGSKWESNYQYIGNASTNNTGKFRVVNGDGFLVEATIYPSRSDYVSVKNISADENWEWKGADGWVLVDSVSGAEQTADGRHILRYRTMRLDRRHINNSDNKGDGTSQYFIPNTLYNEWEQATFQFIVSENFSLEDRVCLRVKGNYGDFGTLYVDNVKIDLMMTSEMRATVDDTAILAPLELVINEVVDSNTIRVESTYDEAAAQQGSVLANFKVNKYTEFDKGFEVDYVSVPASEDDVFARYEGKVLDVVNDDLTKKIIVDKTYQEFGNEINAIMTGSNAVDAMSAFENYFVRYRINDPDNLYTYLITGPDSKSLITNFKPVNSENYPGSIAYKLLEPLADTIEPLDMVYIAKEVTPSLNEKVDLIPFLDEKIPDTVLRLPRFQDLDSPIRERQTEFLSHTDIVGNGKWVREQLEDKLLSGSIETANINVDYRQYKNFVHFGSVEKRLYNMKVKLTNLETYQNYSSSLSGNLSGSGYLGSAQGASVSGAAADIQKWEDEARAVVNAFDDFEQYMFIESSSYITSSMGEFYDNAAPKLSGDGTLTTPYKLYSVSSSQFTTWYSASIVTAQVYDRNNANRMVNLLPEHISYDQSNKQFLTFMDMMGHHYDNIWSHIVALTDVHDRTEDVTKGISQALVEPVAKGFGFQMQEGRDLVRLPQYYLGLQESGSNTGIFNVRWSKKSQKDVTREIWNRILASMPYILKSKGTKQGLKAIIAAYGIPTSILRTQEYGGPKIQGEKDYEIKQRFTKALDFQGGQYLEAPWYHTGFGRTPDTIEMRFKTPYEADTVLAQKINSTDGIDASLYISNVTASDAKGRVEFVMSSSAHGEYSMSLGEYSVYNDEWWSLMLRRRSTISSSLSSSYDNMHVLTDIDPLTQSFDLFLGYYDSGIDEVVVAASSSMDISGSLLANYYRTSSVAGDDNWYFGGKRDDANRGEQFSGSMMEIRYWGTPLTSSAFYNHVAAPKAVNGNHISSSYYDMSFRLSLDDYINLNSSPYGLKDYSLSDGQLYATGSGFADLINFSSVSDRQKAFTPAIGLGKKSNKIRIEGSQLKTPDGLPAVLSTTERVEVSSFDLAANDSNKLGIFFAPSDVINEDIILSLADMDFGSYLGDPRDDFEEDYTYGRFKRIADTYWQKWTTKQGFWDYIKLIKYYDLSLFDHLRRMSPARAKKNIGLLIEPTILERAKVVVGAPPSMEDLKKKAILDMRDNYHVSSSRQRYRGVLNYIESYEVSGSDVLERAGIASSGLGSEVTSSNLLQREALFNWDSSQPTSSNLLQRTTISIPGNAVSMSSTRLEYETVSSSGVIPTNLTSFNFQELQEPINSFNDYSGSSILTGGGDNIFFEVIPPFATGSRLSRHNQDTIPFYSSSLSASYNLPYSSSLEQSEFESVYDSHTALARLAYGGCKEDGSTVPFGELLAVEIFETNPYQVKSDTKGGKYLDTELKGE